MGKTKQCLTVLVDIELSLVHLIPLRELFQSVLCLRGINIWNHRSFSGVFIMEGMDILNELSDVFYKLLKELGLLVLEILLFVF